MYKILLVILTSWLLAACQSSSVIVDYDTTTDFKSISSYQLVKGKPADDPLIAERSFTALEQALQSKGLRKDDNTADVKISIDSSVSIEELESKSRGGIGIGGGGSNVGIGVGLSFPLGPKQNVKFVSLIIDIKSTENGKLLWRGSDEIALRKEDPQQITREIKTAVNKILSEFPPQPSSNKIWF